MWNLISQINEELNLETAHKQMMAEALSKIYGDDNSLVSVDSIVWKLCEADDEDRKNAGAGRSAEAEWIQQHAKDKQQTPAKANSIIKDPRLQNAGVDDTTNKPPQKGEYVRFKDGVGMVVDVDIQGKQVMIKHRGKEAVVSMDKLVKPSIQPLKAGGKAKIWMFA